MPVVELLSYLPGVERPRGNVVAFTGKNMREAAGFLNVALYVNVD
jgi:hypothetical protein